MTMHNLVVCNSHTCPLCHHSSCREKGCDDQAALVNSLALPISTVVASTKRLLNNITNSVRSKTKRN